MAALTLVRSPRRLYRVYRGMWSDRRHDDVLWPFAASSRQERQTVAKQFIHQVLHDLLVCLILIYRMTVYATVSSFNWGYSAHSSRKDVAIRAPKINQ